MFYPAGFKFTLNQRFIYFMGILKLMRIPCPTRFDLKIQIKRGASLHPSRPTQNRCDIPTNVANT